MDGYMDYLSRRWKLCMVHFANVIQMVGIIIIIDIIIIIFET